MKYFIIFLVAGSLACSNPKPPPDPQVRIAVVYTNGDKDTFIVNCRNVYMRDAGKLEVDYSDKEYNTVLAYYVRKYKVLEPTITVDQKGKIISVSGGLPSWMIDSTVTPPKKIKTLQSRFWDSVDFTRSERFKTGDSGKVRVYRNGVIRWEYPQNGLIPSDTTIIFKH